MAGKTIGAHADHRETAARTVDFHWPKQRVHLALDLLRHLCVRKRPAALRFFRRHQPDKTRSMRLAVYRAQRDEGAGAGASVKFGRNIAVRLGVRQQRGIGDLRIGPALRSDLRFGRHECIASFYDTEQTTRLSSCILACYWT